MSAGTSSSDEDCVRVHVCVCVCVCVYVCVRTCVRVCGVHGCILHAYTCVQRCTLYKEHNTYYYAAILHDHTCAPLGWLTALGVCCVLGW